MPTVNTEVCRSFSAAPGTGINWTNIPPTGCTLTQDGAKPWPFNVGPPIALPAPMTVFIKPDLKPGTYCFRATCCEKPVCFTVA